MIFLGGRGVSGSPKGKDLTTFANNDGWFDDVSDGSVKARVTIEGREIPVKPSWVVVAPPNYAPDIVSIQTMYDLTHEASQAPEILYHTKPSFIRDILPLLRQFTDIAWVNFGFHAQFGWGAPYDFLNSEFVKRLATYKEDQKQDEPMRNFVDIFLTCSEAKTIMNCKLRAGLRSMVMHMEIMTLVLEQGWLSPRRFIAIYKNG